jgi:hypothetical protein
LKIYQTTQGCIPEESNFHSHHHNNLVYCMVFDVFMAVKIKINGLVGYNTM